MSSKMFSFGLVGYPLQQSLSPLLHSSALRMMGLEGAYRLFPISMQAERAEGLVGLVAKMRSGQIQGLNVTIPYKQSIIQYLDDLTPAARAIGAVNTIFYQDGQVVGDNTDAPGFMTDLMRVATIRGEITKDSREGQIALVLGAGGAARAVVYALRQAGWDVVVAARRPEQAEDLIASFLPSKVVRSEKALSLFAIPIDSKSIKDFEQSSVHYKSKILVNATPAGMLPNIASCPWPIGVHLPKDIFVYDLIYKPLETVFLRAARSVGVSGSNGLGMLVEQAALSLERWTCRPVPRRAMWQAVRHFPDQVSEIHIPHYSPGENLI